MTKTEYFSEYYNQYFDIVFLFVYQRIPLKQDVEDVVSETFSALWQNFDSLDKSKSIKNYLLGIASHKVNDFLRKKYRSDSFEVRIDLENFETLEKFTQKNQPEKLILELVKNLTQDEKEFIELKYINKMSFSQISKKLEITKNNAKVKNNRILKKLKKLWNQKIV